MWNLILKRMSIFTDYLSVVKFYCIYLNEVTSKNGHTYVLDSKAMPDFLIY